MSRPRAGAVIAPNWLGDAVMCLPALAALLQAQPQCRWTLLARPGVAPVFAATRLRIEILPLPPPPGLRLPPLAVRPEVAIAFPNSFYSGLQAWRLGAPRRIGFARDRRAWLLTDAIPPPAAGGVHESFHYLELLRRAGLIAAPPPAAPEPVPAMVRLHPAAAAVHAWREQLGGGEAIVALHVGATFGTAKRWLPERFAELAARLAAGGRRVVLIGAPGERALAEQVRLAASPAVRNLAGATSLDDLIALLAAVDLLVANDSGPMHLAAAVGTPVVALFGSTNERETYPLAAPGGLDLLKAPGVACSPCKLRECPIDHRCMTRIPTADALAAVEARLPSR